MIKRMGLYFFMMVLVFSLTACWSAKDLTEFSIVTAFGVDKEADGKITFSAQVIKPSSAKASGGGESAGSGGKDKSFLVVSHTEDTVFSSIRGLLNILNKKLFNSTAPVIVIGERAAEGGVSELLDLVLRDHETQYKALVIMAKGTTAKEILEQEYELSKVPGDFIANTIENNESTAFTEKKNLLQVARELVTEGSDLSIPTVKKAGSTTQTEGIAVFLKDKFAGYLDKYETRGYLFATGEVKSSILEVESPLDKKEKIAIEIKKVSSKQKLEWDKNGSPKFTFNIEMKGNIGEKHIVKDIEENKLIKMLEENCNKVIKAEVLSSIAKCQKEYHSDIFGFGAKVFDKKPDYWKSVKENWNKDILPNIEVDVKVDTKLLRSGLITKSLEVQ